MRSFFRFLSCKTNVATLAMISLTFIMVSSPVQAAKARTGKKGASSVSAPVKISPTSAAGDYIVAVVNSSPVTNYEVNQRARELSQQLTQQGAPIATHEALLNQALREVILQKAAIQSVRNTNLTVTDDEFSNAEKQLANERHVSVQEFRRRIMAERAINETGYRKELTDQMLLSKMRTMRSSEAADKVTEMQAIQWLRTQPSNNANITEDHIRHILRPANDEASARQATEQLASIRKRIVSGKLDFATAAREFSQDGSAAQGGDLGWVPANVLVPEFQEQVNALKPGEMSQPFASRFGVHLVQLLDRRSSAMTQSQQIQAAMNVLRQKKIEEALKKWESEVRAQAYIEMREAPR